MSEEDSPVIVVINNAIAEICLNRPSVLNAANVEMAEGLQDAVSRLSMDKSVRVILLTGAGRAFMAGGDLRYLRDAKDKVAAARELIAPMHAAVEAIASAPQPVIASLHGSVAGAGMSLMMVADLAVAERGTVFNMAFAKVGINPDSSGSWTLPRIVGVRKAMEITMLSDDISAEEALSLGLINRLAETGEHELEALKLAERIARASPAAMCNIKRLLRASHHNSLETQLHAEADAFIRAANSYDFSEAISAFFERRVPQFSGE